MIPNRLSVQIPGAIQQNGDQLNYFACIQKTLDFIISAIFKIIKSIRQFKVFSGN